MEFPGSAMAHWAERHDGMRLIERRPMPPFGHFSLIRFAKERNAPRSRFAEVRAAG